MLQICGKSELKGVFQWLMDQQEDGVEGVHRIIRGNPSRRDLALVMTHGKEPAGLAFVDFILRNTDVLQDIDLTIGIGNMVAAQRYFKTDDPVEKAKCRYYQLDMNRMPADWPAVITTTAPYELRRAAQLKSILPGLRSVLDIHSTDQDSAGMGLDIGGDLAKLDPLMSAMIFQTRLCGITPVQKAMGTKTQPFCAIFDAESAMELEASQHESEEGLRRSVLNGMSWLANLGCVRGGMAKKPATQDVYTVLASVMVPNEDQTYVMADDKYLKMYAPVQKDEVIAVNNRGDQLLSPVSGLCIFGPDERTLTRADVVSELLWVVSEKTTIQREITVPECVGHLLG